MKLLKIEIILFAVFNLLILQAGQGESNRNSRASLDEQEVVTDSVTKGQVENRDEQLQADDTLVESGQVTTWYDYAKIAVLVGLSLGVIGAVGYTNRDQISHLVDATKNWWHGYAPVSVYSAEQLAEFRAGVERRKHELIVAWQKKFGADSKPLELGALSKENVKLYNEKRQWLKDHGVIPANDFEQNLYNPDGSIKGTASLSNLPLASTQKDEMRENRRLQQMLRESLYDQGGALTEQARKKLLKIIRSEGRELRVNLPLSPVLTNKWDAELIDIIQYAIDKKGALNETDKLMLENMLLISPQFITSQLVENVEGSHKLIENGIFNQVQRNLEHKYDFAFIQDSALKGGALGVVAGTAFGAYDVGKMKKLATPISYQKASKIIGHSILKTAINFAFVGLLSGYEYGAGYTKGLVEGAFSYPQIDAAPVVKVE